MCKKNTSFAAAMICVLFLTGCVLTPRPKHEVANYDLQVSAATETQSLFTIVSITNSTPAGSKFFYRSNDNKIQTDHYRNWVQTPEAMLSRYFMKRFPRGGENINQIEVKLEIIGFEFDRKNSEAVLACNYLLRKADRRQHGIISIRKKYTPNVDSMVAAMNNAVEAASIQLLQDVEKFAAAK